MDNDTNLVVATLTNSNSLMIDNRLNFKNTCGILKTIFHFFSTCLVADVVKSVFVAALTMYFSILVIT